MKIQVKELGAIKEGTIDLSKKLNVFCGPNGTGKTYMAYVIYALTKLNNKSIGIRLSDDFVKQALVEKQFSIEINSEILLNFRNSEVLKTKNNLWNLFSVQESKSDTFFQKTEINVIESNDEFVSNFVALEFDTELNYYSFSFSLLKKINSKIINVKVKENGIKNEDFTDFLEIVFLSRLYSLLAFYPISNSIIFPVERNSIYTFSKELSLKRNEAFDHIEAIANKKDADLIDLFFKRSTRYPQPIKDCLQMAEDLENKIKINSPYYNFATEIETELLKGKVVVTKYGSVEFSSDKAAKTQQLSFHQSSSIVKTLASLVIYLKHEAQHNDLVIIDEPEVNLHPDNQIKLARIFSRLVNKGLRLIISTHSDYIVREFNNLIMIEKGDEKLKKLAKDKGDYREDEYLIANEVAAYVFDFKATRGKEALKTEVKQITITESGFDIPSVDKEIQKQNTIAEELYYSLKYGTINE
jgi:predicted ATPase